MDRIIPIKSIRGNDGMDAIFNRRSVRKYLAKPIPEEDVTTLLKAAMRAPSAGNEQPWEFVVLRRRETMEGIMEFHPYARMLREADCAIVICGNMELQKFPHDYWIQDCSAATQNLLIEAVHLGIGAVWLGIYPIEERYAGMQRLLGLPGHVIPLGAVALGYPSEQPEPMDTYRPERVHLEKWHQ